MAQKALPRHIGFIPDGNRRWAERRDMPREAGYAFGIHPGLALYELCKRQGVEEVSVYGFTQDNTRRPTPQTERFRTACVAFALEIANRGAALLVVGDDSSAQFPSRAQAVPAAPRRGRQGQHAGELWVGIGRGRAAAARHAALG